MADDSGRTRTPEATTRALFHEEAWEREREANCASTAASSALRPRMSRRAVMSCGGCCWGGASLSSCGCAVVVVVVALPAGVLGVGGGKGEKGGSIGGGGGG